MVVVKYSQQRWPLGSPWKRSKGLLASQFPWLVGSRWLGGCVHSYGAMAHVAGHEESSLCNLRRQQRNKGHELVLAQILAFSLTSC